MNRPFAIAGKELKLFFRDFQGLFFSLALPLVLIFLMVAAFGGQTSFHATAYVVNLDQGEAGAEFVARLDATPEITVETLTQAEAERRLEDTGILNYLVVGPDFTARLEAGETPEIKVFQRGTGGNEGQITNSYAIGIARSLTGEYLIARQVEAALAGIGHPVDPAVARAKVDDLFAEVKASPPVTVTEETVGARPEPVAIYLPGLVTMFTLFSVSLTSVALVEERKKGTVERLMTTRVSRGEYLLGNWLGSFGRGYLQVLFLFGLAWAAFRIFTPASFAAVLAFSAVAIFAVAGIGLVIAALSRTSEMANWVAVFFTMIMTMLGGSFFDTAGAKGIMAVLTRLTYNFWANDGLRRIISKGEALTSAPILKDMAVLIGIGLGAWAVALTFFRLRGDDK